MNGATCGTDTSTMTYICTCAAGFTGTECQTDINDCSRFVSTCFYHDFSSIQDSPSHSFATAIYTTGNYTILADYARSQQNNK